MNKTSALIAVGILTACAAIVSGAFLAHLASPSLQMNEQAVKHPATTPPIAVSYNTKPLTKNISAPKIDPEADSEWSDDDNGNDNKTTVSLYDNAQDKDDNSDKDEADDNDDLHTFRSSPTRSYSRSYGSDTVVIRTRSISSGNTYTLEAEIDRDEFGDTTITRIFFPKGGWVTFTDCNVSPDYEGLCTDDEGRDWEMEGE